MIEYLEPFVELSFEKPKLNLQDITWVPYNPRKKIQRWGASLTSLDGGVSGLPDLDSIREYNLIHHTNYTEKDFNQPTRYFEPFNFLNQHFKLGRSHILKLDSGAFFPYHRDLDTDTFRLIYTISGCESSNLVFILNKTVLNLENEKWYYVNTKLLHSVFSFYGSVFAVFNVLREESQNRLILRHLSEK